MISKEVFKEEVLYLAELVKVQPAQIHIRPMKRKWASCSSTGRLSFNDELLAETPARRREVIAHELLHLRYPNHGKLFKLALKRITKDNIA